VLIRAKERHPAVKRASPILADGSHLAELSGDGVTVAVRFGHATARDTPARLTSENTSRKPRTGTRRPVEPVGTRHDTPALSMPATRNYPPLLNPGNRDRHPNA
jgi:hypothetical protein